MWRSAPLTDADPTPRPRNPGYVLPAQGTPHQQHVRNYSRVWGSFKSLLTAFTPMTSAASAGESASPLPTWPCGVGLERQPLARRTMGSPMDGLSRPVSIPTATIYGITGGTVSVDYVNPLSCVPQNPFALTDQSAAMTDLRPATNVCHSDCSQNQRAVL